MRDGIIPAEKINLPADIARFYAGNRRVDGAASGERAAYDGEVFPADHTLLHGFAEQGGGEHIFGDDDQAARVGIQPVDAAERADFAFCTVISRDGVCKRIPLVRGRRVYRHACRLVNHQKIFVLVTDREGNLLRKNGGAGSILLQMKTEKVAGVKRFIHMRPHAVQEGAVVCFL